MKMIFNLRIPIDRILVFFFFIQISQMSYAQADEIVFSPLASNFYSSKIDVLKKYKVANFSSNKSAQAWYDEIVKDRNKTLLEAFEKDEVVYDSVLLNKCNNIFKRIIASNTKFRFDSIQLFINRSAVANAQCFGEGTILINLGLFLWVDSDDELALVIGHELSHQLLNHFDSRVKKTIEMLTSSEFNEELKNIKKSDYGKYDRYRKLMKGVSMESGKHSTYKESEADSLGVVLAKNAGYNTIDGAKILLKLDKVDDIFKSNKLYTTKDFFAETQIESGYFATKPKYNGLSSMKVTMNADKEFDSIKTHPDCINRYQTITGKKSEEIEHCCIQLTFTNKKFKERALEEMVRYLYENNRLGLCAHFCFVALKNEFDPVYFNYFLSLSFSKLFYADKKFSRFSAANCYAETSSNLKELQDFLFNVSSADIEKLAKYFSGRNPAKNEENLAFESLVYNTQVKMKDIESLTNNFKNKYPKSKFNYLITKK